MTAMTPKARARAVQLLTATRDTLRPLARSIDTRDGNVLARICDQLAEAVSALDETRAASDAAAMPRRSRWLSRPQVTMLERINKTDRWTPDHVKREGATLRALLDRELVTWGGTDRGYILTPAGEYALAAS